MPRTRPQAEDTEDFEAELNAIRESDFDSESGDEREDDSDMGGDLETLRKILTVPQPDAPMHEVRKVSLHILLFSCSVH